MRSTLTWVPIRTVTRRSDGGATHRRALVVVALLVAVGLIGGFGLTTNPFRSSSSPAGLADPTTRRTLLGLTSDDLRVAEEISVRYLSDLVASHSELVDATVVGTFPVFDEDTALPVGAMVRVSFPMPVPTVTLT